MSIEENKSIALRMLNEAVGQGRMEVMDELLADKYVWHGPAGMVFEGREELNFSTWNRYSHKERAKKIQESWEEVEEREMPPWFYVPLHPEARLSDEDLAVLRAWGAQQVFLQEDEEDHDDDSD